MTMETITAVRQTGQNTELDSEQLVGLHLGKSPSRDGDDGFTRYWDRAVSEPKNGEEHPSEEDKEERREDRRDPVGGDPQAGRSQFPANVFSSSVVPNFLGTNNRGQGGDGLSVVPQFGRTKSFEPSQDEAALSAASREEGIEPAKKAFISRQDVEAKQTNKPKPEEEAKVAEETNERQEAPANRSSEKKPQLVAQPILPTTTVAARDVTGAARSSVTQSNSLPNSEGEPSPLRTPAGTVPQVSATPVVESPRAGDHPVVVNNSKQSVGRELNGEPMATPLREGEAKGDRPAVAKANEGIDKKPLLDSKKISGRIDLNELPKPTPRAHAKPSNVAVPVATQPTDGEVATPAAKTVDAGVQGSADNGTMQSKVTAKTAPILPANSEPNDLAANRAPVNPAKSTSTTNQAVADNSLRSRAGTSEAVAESRNTASSQTGNAAAAVRTQVRPVASAPNATASAPAGATVQSLDIKAGSGSGSQRQSGGDTGRQEGATMMKPAQFAGKGAEKGSGESSQSFSVESASSASTRKSQASVKAQGTSYASKTSEEVKEVYKALSKGIERMQNLKQDVVNVRINFDQGGSLSLKLNMDNGQLNTVMQTDLNGLEGVIKSTWGDLAGDWAQRGLKLNAPQFTQATGEGKGDASQSFDTDRHQAGTESGNQREGRGQRSGSAIAQRLGNGPSNSGRSDAETSNLDVSVANGDNGELKVYA